MLVQGGAGAETLNGSTSADTIVGGQGADTLTGGGGADLYRFARGDSTFSATDLVTDFQADDRLDFGLEPATAENAVVLTAATRNDAASQASAAFANSAIRYAAVSVGANLHIFVNDAVSGQEGTMVTLVNPGANLSLGNITGVVPPNPNLFVGTDGPDNLTGTAAADTIQGDGGSDTILGGQGSDRLTGGAGSDRFKFGIGDSTVSTPDQITDFTAEDRLDFGIEAATDANAIAQTAGSLSAATSQASAAFAANSALRYVATTVGSNLHIFASDADGGQTAGMVTLVAPGAGLSFANITGYTPVNPNLFVGTAGADFLTGTATADTIQGAGGADTIVGGLGADRLTGGTGADLFKIAPRDSTTAAPDQITDFQSDDRIDFGLEAATATNAIVQSAASLNAAISQASATFAANSALRYVATTVGGDLHLFASTAAGGQTASMATLLNPGVGLSLSNFAGWTQNPNLITGTPNADTLQGSATAAETLQGLAGNDTLIGDGSLDTLYGGEGDDTFAFDIRSGSTTVDGGSGSDTLDFLGSTAPNHGVLFEFTPLPSSPPATFFGDPQPAIQFTGIENLRGTGYYDILGGDDAANVIWGAGGGDLINGWGGNDTIDGGDGDDSLRGWNGDDVLLGGAGADLINGLNGDDTISAGDGDDTLRGDEGTDVLTGGTGNDLFDFEPGHSPAATPDQVLDFEAGDRIDFRMVQGTVTNYTETTAATLATATSQANAAFAANSALRYIATQVGSDVQLFASSGGPAQSLVTLKGASTAAIGFGNIVGTTAPPVDPYVITGTDGPDALAGSAAPETINGLGGADTITGGGNADVLSGGGGDDLFKFAAGDSVYAASTPTTIASYGDRIVDFEGGSRGNGVAGGTGDQLDFGYVRGTATNYLENTAATKEAAVTQANAAFAASVGLRYVAAQVGGDVLVFASAGGQTASLVTLSGADVGALSFLNIAGTAPSNNQILDGTAGRDTLVGGTGNDVLTGFADSDSLSGGAGNDTLLSGDGQDTLIGGLGNDRLSGGANEDRFVFGPGDSGEFFNGVITPGTADIVTDFQTGIDILTFGMGAAIGTPGSGNYTELSTLFTTYANAETAAQTTFSAQPSLIYVVTQVGSDTYVFVDTGGTTDADSIIYLQGVALSGIAATDIV